MLYLMYQYLFNNSEGVSSADVTEQVLQIADTLFTVEELSRDNYESLISIADSVDNETSGDTERVVLWRAVFERESFGLSDERISKIRSFLDAAYNSSESSQAYASRYASGIADFVTDTLSDIGSTAGDLAEAAKPSSWMLPLAVATTAVVAVKVL